MTTTFDLWANIAFWVVTWLTAVFYTMESRLPPKKALRRMATIVVTAWGVILLLKMGVPGGEFPPYFWRTP